MSEFSKIHKQVNVQFEMLDRLMERHAGLVELCRGQEPSPVEIDALAATLHAFYSGVENIFKRIAVALDGGAPQGENSHIRLLVLMSNATAIRKQVISSELKVALKEYLEFRHMFRHAYTQDLNWSKMKPRVFAMRQTYEQLKLEVQQFLSQLV